MTENRMTLKHGPHANGWLVTLLLTALLMCAGAVCAQGTEANSPAALRAKYGALQDRLKNNPFQKPLHLDSSEAPGGVSGNIYALVSYPFATVASTLNSPGNWCDVLLLHLNTKYCRPSNAGQGDVLNVSIGKKYDQPVNDAHRVVFAYHVAAQTPDYLSVRLNADKGPLSTQDYRIVFEAVPLDSGQTFIHLSYSYAFGTPGRLAMQAYLGTVGRDKVGFTLAGTQAGGQRNYIGGMRGLVERNTMRYYLAIEAFLGAAGSSPPARFEKSSRDWFAATERYPRQLHEMEQDEYLQMKRKEYARQQAGAQARNEIRGRQQMLLAALLYYRQHPY